MATYLGSFPPGSQPVALFSGLRVSPRGYRGFGGVWADGPCVGLDSVRWQPTGPTSCQEISSDTEDGGSGSDTDWGQFIRDILGDVLPIFDPVLKKWLNPNTGQPLPVQPPAGMSVAEVLRILEAQKSSLPAWLLPVGIGVGVLVVGGVLYAVLRRS